MEQEALQNIALEGGTVDLNGSNGSSTESVSLPDRVSLLPKWIWLAMAGTLLVAAGASIWLSWNNWHLKDRFIWNTKIAGADVGGLTISEARTKLTGIVDDFQRRLVTVKTNYGDYQIIHASFSPDFDINGALADAFQFGHTDDARKNVTDRLLALATSRSIGLPSTFDENQFLHIIRTRVPILASESPKDAYVKLVGRDFVVVPGESGYGFDEQAAISAYDTILLNFGEGIIELTVLPEEPDIDSKEARRAQWLAARVIRRSLVPVYSYDGYNYDRWTVELWSRRNWVEFRKVKEDDAWKLYPVLKPDKLRRDLNTRIAPYMYRAKEDVRIDNVDGEPVAVGVAKDGYYLDVPKSIKKINRAIMSTDLDSSGNYAVLLEVAHLKGGIANPENEFGISDVLATGVTDFFGSPQNRKFNIGHASKNFHNVFLKPKERFSFIQHMGKVDSTTGYAKELVIINGDSLEPQYGGGICQVSSTLFRTVFFAGLKILQRSNHSFEVKYYLPAGLDATVFDPSPDLVFQNDTENLLLIQNLVDMERTKMYFKIYGKNDGRKLRFIGPNKDGPVGEEEEHYRVTWYRDIEYPDGKTKRDKFASVYRNKELVKKYQPENLLVQKDSVFVPVSIDTMKFQPAKVESTSAESPIMQ